jgi:hypothetical protein
MKSDVRQLWQRPAVRTGVIVFVILRVMLSVWVWGVRQVYTAPLPPDEWRRPYKGVAVERDPWLEPWQRWDTLHYQAIAERGYTAFDTALFVPPLYPLLMRWLAVLLGGSTLLAGLFISNLACLAALIAFYHFAYDATLDHAAARRAVIYLASFPAAFFLFAAYTESLYLLAAVLCLYAVSKARWGWAGVWGATAALARLPGAILILPLAYAAWNAWRKDRRWQPWTAVALTLAGAAIFPLYAWLGMGLPPWAPLTAQAVRTGGGVAFPGLNVLVDVARIASGQGHVADVLDVIFILVFTACAVPVWRRLDRVSGLYYAALLLMYLARLGAVAPMLGMARYVLALFPALVLWGEWGRRGWVNRLILYPSWVGLLFMAGQFAIWGWVG